MWLNPKPRRGRCLKATSCACLGCGIRRYISRAGEGGGDGRRRIHCARAAYESRAVWAQCEIWSIRYHAPPHARYNNQGAFWSTMRPSTSAACTLAWHSLPCPSTYPLALSSSVRFVQCSPTQDGGRGSNERAVTSLPLHAPNECGARLTPRC